MHPIPRVVTVPPSLAGSAVDLASEGVDEIAFPKAAALAVLDLVLAKGLLVLGGDVWTVRDDSSGLRPAYENWSVEDNTSAEAGAIAREFIETRVRESDYVVFVLEGEDIAIG